MDSLFYNTPRPFNKFPNGYRPVNGAGHGSSPSRQFGSMTSLLQAPFDSSTSPLRNNNSSSYASLPHAESTYQPYGISSRGGSVGPYGEPPLVGSGFSSRDPSPSRYGYNPVREPTRPVASPPYQQTSPVNQAGDDFLNKLRRQKEEIERAFPRYNSYPEQAPIPIRESRDTFPDTYRQNVNHVNQDSFYQQNEPPNNFVQSSHVPLHKTRSDSHVVRNQIYPNNNGNAVQNGGNDRMSSSFYEDRNNDSGFYNHNRPEKAGFFRRSLHEPNWMTDPPPPIDIAPRMQERQGNGLQRSNSFIRNSFVEDPRVIPIQLEDDRVLKIIPPQPSNGYHQPQQVPLTVKTTPPYYSRNEEPVHLPSNDVYNDRYYSKPSTDPRANYRAQSQSLPNSPPSTVNHGFNHFAERPTRGTQPMRRERVASPTGFPDIPSSFRDELLSVIPQKSRKSPFTNRQSVLQNNEFEAPFSPVASKIYEGHNRINGFINDRPLAGTFQPMNGGAHHAAVPNRERSFAVVSRPVTPPASLEHVQRFSPPPPLQRPAVQAENERYGRRAFSPPSSIPLSNERRTFSPVSSNMSPTDSQPTSRSQMSPMSSLYDNDSETEVFKPRKPFNFSPPPQGILLKNHDAPRPAKKVVFQCDNEAVDRLMRDMRLTTSPVDAPPHVREFDNAVEDLMSQFTTLSDQIGGDVAVMKSKVVSTFDALRSFLWTAAGRAEATGDEVQKLVAPIVKHLEEINTFKDSKRNTPQFNHLSAVAEGIPAVGWVLVKKTPGPYVKEMTDAAMFYVNRILKEFKDSDAKQVEWVKTWKEILDSMQKFVRQTHTTGLVWNSAPGSAPSGSAAGRSGPPPPPAGGPPPPPPPPPADLMADVSKASADKAGRDALFAELNKGEKVTAGLRKVTADMQTHKNPNLRGSGTVSAATPSASRGAAGATSAPVKKPAKVELQDGKQWNVEYHVGNKNIVVEIGDKKQTVYVYKCENSVIQVKGKLNSITLDGCKKTSIVFDAVVAQCETINCQSVQIQTLGEMPTLSIQKTDGCQVYLSEAAKNTEIVTSKSSEMNILVPEGPDGEFNEFPVPEQFKTVYSGGKLVTQASDII